jgi:NAD(P)H-hydrate epimerase
MPALTRDAVRAFDKVAIAAGIPGPVLMENAARGAVDLLLSLGVTGPVSVVCGKGNNGGDGFAMARLLHARSVPVSVELVASSDELTGDARTAFTPLGWLGVPCHPCDQELIGRLRRSAWIIDAVLGTGTRGEVRAPFAGVIETINEARRPVLAVDLPSGLDCDSGLPLGPTVRAQHTATFVARKLGFDHLSSERYTGKVHVISIGVPA